MEYLYRDTKMLIEKKTTSVGDIVTFRIISGEEIVGKYLGEVAGGHSINKPVIIAMQMVGPQQASLGFLPLLAAASDDFTLTFAHHSVIAPPIKAREDVAGGYKNATSSIVQPTAQQSGLILGG
jgi:hypothetical protein